MAVSFCYFQRVKLIILPGSVWWLKIRTNTIRQSTALLFASQTRTSLARLVNQSSLPRELKMIWNLKLLRGTCCLLGPSVLAAQQSLSLDIWNRFWDFPYGSWSHKQSCKSSDNLVKIKNHSHKQWCHKYKKIGAVRIGTFPIIPLDSGENQIVIVASGRGKTYQSQCLFPCIWFA